MAEKKQAQKNMQTNASMNAEQATNAERRRKYLRDKKRQKVTGKFVFHEVPGGTLEFVYREYKEDPIEKYKFTDGQVIEIPYGVALHLKKNCWYRVHSYQTDEKGNPTSRIGKKVQRADFYPLEFIDTEDFKDDPELVSIEEVNRIG